MYIPKQQAFAIIGKVPLAHWATKTKIPQDERKNFNREYLLRLREYAGNEKPTYIRAQLCALEWRLKYGDEQEKRLVEAATSALKSKGILLISSEVATMLGRQQQVVLRWTKSKFLPAVRLALRSRGTPTFVYLTEDILRTKEIIEGLTSIEAGIELGVGRHAINLKIKEGKLPATMTPMGMRLRPADVAAYKQQQIVEDGLRRSEVARLLKISPYTPIEWGRDGHLPFVVDKQGRHLYDRATVLRIKAKQEEICGGYPWLKITANDRTYTVQQAARKLTVTTFTVHDWIASNLLPYFNLSPEWVTQKLPLLIAAYIDEFIVYCRQQGGAPSKPLARSYKEYRYTMASKA